MVNDVNSVIFILCSLFLSEIHAAPSKHVKLENGQKVEKRSPQENSRQTYDERIPPQSYPPPGPYSYPFPQGRRMPQGKTVNRLIDRLSDGIAEGLSTGIQSGVQSSVYSLPQVLPDVVSGTLSNLKNQYLYGNKYSAGPAPYPAASSYSALPYSSMSPYAGQNIVSFSSGNKYLPSTSLPYSGQHVDVYSSLPTSGHYTSSRPIAFASPQVYGGSTRVFGDSPSLYSSQSSFFSSPSNLHAGATSYIKKPLGGGHHTIAPPAAPYHWDCQLVPAHSPGLTSFGSLGAGNVFKKPVKLFRDSDGEMDEQIENLSNLIEEYQYIEDMAKASTNNRMSTGNTNYIVRPMMNGVSNNRNFIQVPQQTVQLMSRSSMNDGMEPINANDGFLKEMEIRKNLALLEEMNMSMPPPSMINRDKLVNQDMRMDDESMRMDEESMRMGNDNMGLEPMSYKMYGNMRMNQEDPIIYYNFDQPIKYQFDSDVMPEVLPLPTRDQIQMHYIELMNSNKGGKGLALGTQKQMVEAQTELPDTQKQEGGAQTQVPVNAEEDQKQSLNASQQLNQNGEVSSQDKKGSVKETKEKTEVHEKSDVREEKYRQGKEEEESLMENNIIDG